MKLNPGDKVLVKKGDLDIPEMGKLVGTIQTVEGYNACPGWIRLKDNVYNWHEEWLEPVSAFTTEDPLERDVRLIVTAIVEYMKQTKEDK